MRIRNVTTSGFQIQTFESQGENGSTTATSVSYLAVMPGTYVLPGGSVLEAGSVSISNHQGRNVAGASWQTLNFASTFAGAPVVLTELQTNANGTLAAGTVASPWMTTAVRSITATSLQLALERSETSNGTLGSPETVAYLAISPGAVDSFNDSGAALVSVRAIRSSDIVAGWDNGCTAVNFGASFSAPIALADKATRDGSDGGWLRRCNLTAGSIGVTVDEDRAVDTERSHTTEIANVLVFSQAFDALLPGGGWEADEVTVSSAGGAVLNFTSHTFAQPMDAVPVVVTQPTQNGSAPASIRLRNVTASGFEAAAVEPPGSAGAHTSMTLDYLAVVPGAHELQDGALFEAGFVDTTQVQRASNVGGSQGWANVNFAQSYSSPPAFLAQLQTTQHNEPAPDPSIPIIPWLTTAVSNHSASSVSVALERSEADNGSVSTSERIGYVAFTTGRHSVLVDEAGANVEYDTRVAPGAVQGFDDGCFAVSFTAPFSSIPLAIGHGLTRFGNNGGWLRRCAISGSALSQHWDEDQDNDSERAHISEDVAQIAFERAFVWSAFPNIVMTSALTAIDDQISATQAKSIPGAVIETQVLVMNTGAGEADADSVAMTFDVPTGVTAFVGDLDGAGHPVAFVDGVGADVSGLTWLDPAAQIQFSNDGGVSFGYTPPPGADFDAQVTHFRVVPDGTLSGATVGTPQFTIRYRYRVD